MSRSSGSTSAPLVEAPSISISLPNDAVSSASSATGSLKQILGPCAHLGCECCLGGTCISESEIRNARDEEAAAEEEVVRLARYLDTLQERLNSLQVHHNTTIRNMQKEIVNLDFQGSAVESALREVEKVRSAVVGEASKVKDQRERLRMELGQSQVELVGRFGARKYRMMLREDRIDAKRRGVFDEPVDGAGSSTSQSKTPLEVDHRASVASAGTSASSGALNKVYSSGPESVSAQQKVGSQQKLGGSTSKHNMSRRKSKLTDAVSQYLEKQPSARKRHDASKSSPSLSNNSGEPLAVDTTQGPPSPFEETRALTCEASPRSLERLEDYGEPTTVEAVVQSLDRQTMEEKGEAVLKWFKQKQASQPKTEVVESCSCSAIAMPPVTFEPSPPPKMVGVSSSPSLLMSSRKIEAAKRALSGRAALLRPTERGVQASQQ